MIDNNLLASQVIKANNRLTEALENGGSGGGEQWETIFEDSNGAITGEYTKVLDIDAGETIRVTRVTQGRFTDIWNPQIVIRETLFLGASFYNNDYELLIVKSGDGTPFYEHIGIIQYSDMDFSYLGNPVVDKVIYKIERLIK